MTIQAFFSQYDTRHNINSQNFIRGCAKYFWWTRDLNFCAAILNVGLWVLLIGSRQKDRKLLLITGGLGLQFTGGAIGQALRDMSPTIVAAASDFLMITNVARIYIWWVAFRAKPKTPPSADGSSK